MTDHSASYPKPIPSGFLEWVDAELRLRWPSPYPTADLRARCPLKFGKFGANNAFGRLLTQCGYELKTARAMGTTLRCVMPQESPPAQIRMGRTTYIRQDLCQERKSK